MPIGPVSIQKTSWVPPVGMYVTLGVDTSPAQMWAGTSWVQIKDGFLLGASDTHPLGSTGGAWEHTLTVEEMPAHTHTATIENAGEHTHTVGNSYGSSKHTGFWGSSLAKYDFRPTSATGSSGGHTHQVVVGSAGSGSPFSILNPCVAKNVWKRVA